MPVKQLVPGTYDTNWLPMIGVSREVLETFADLFSFKREDAWILLAYLRQHFTFKDLSHYAKCRFPNITGWSEYNCGIKLRSMMRDVARHMHRVIEPTDDIMLHEYNVIKGLFEGYNIVALTDSVPIQVSGVANYSKHYKKRIYKILIISSVTGHILYVSDCYALSDGVGAHDSHIFDACMDPEFLDNNNICLGDCHFSASKCANLITPVTLATLKEVLRNEGRKACVNRMHINECLSHVRARVEHLFHKQFIGRFAFMRNPHLKEPPTLEEASNMFKTAAVVFELETQLLKGDEGRYTPKSAQDIIEATVHLEGNGRRYFEELIKAEKDLLSATPAVPKKKLAPAKPVKRSREEAVPRAERVWNAKVAESVVRTQHTGEDWLQMLKRIKNKYVDKVKDKDKENLKKTKK